jgi:hypothetical protein
VITIEVYLSIGVTIEADTLHHCMPRLVPVSWHLLVLDVFSSAIVIKKVWHFIVVDELDVESFAEARETYKFFHNDCSHTICTIKNELLLIILFALFRLD